MADQQPHGVILLTKYDMYMKVIISLNKTDNYIDLIMLFDNNQTLINLIHNIFANNNLQFSYVRDILPDSASIYESKILRNYDYLTFLKELNVYLVELGYKVKFES